MTRALWLFAFALGCGTTPAQLETRAPEPVDRPAVAAPAETPQAVAVRINREYEGRTAKSWERSFEREGREAHDRRADIVALLELKPGMAVADVGAGTGMFTVELARAVAPGPAYAVDPQPYFLEHVAARARDAKLDNVRTIHADQHTSGLAQGSIDVAFMCDAYHHLELPKTYLADLHAALREGGRLVIIDYDRTRKGTREWMRDHIRADPSEFRAEIESAGFTLLAEPKLLEENFVMIFARS